MKIGVIGFGRRGRGVIYYALKEVEPDIRITGIVDPDEKGVRERLSEEDRERAVFYKTLDDMVRKAKPDALFIGTRCNLHAPYAIEAAKYDLPLFLEKPVAINMEQAVALEKAFENSRCRVVVSFPLRVSPFCVFTRELIERDGIGEPVHIMAWNYVSYGAVYWEQEYRNYKITQGLFLQKATHDFDYIMYLMGMPIVRIGAMATFQKVYGGKKPSGLRCSQCEERETCLESPENRKRSKSYHGNDHPCVFSIDCGTIETGTNEDTSSAIFEFPSGAHGIYTQVFFAKRDAGARGPIVSGYMGTVKFDWYKDHIEYTRHHKPFSDVIKLDPPEGGHGGGDIELVKDLVKLVKDSRYKSRTPIETGLASVYTCLAAKESYQKGKFVNVRQVGQIR